MIKNKNYSIDENEASIEDMKLEISKTLDYLKDNLLDKKSVLITATLRGDDKEKDIHKVLSIGNGANTLKNMYHLETTMLLQLKMECVKRLKEELKKQMINTLIDEDYGVFADIQFINANGANRSGTTKFAMRLNRYINRWLGNIKMIKVGNEPVHTERQFYKFIDKNDSKIGKQGVLSSIK